MFTAICRAKDIEVDGCTTVDYATLEIQIAWLCIIAKVLARPLRQPLSQPHATSQSWASRGASACIFYLYRYQAHTVEIAFAAKGLNKDASCSDSASDGLHQVFKEQCLYRTFIVVIHHTVHFQKLFDHSFPGQILHLPCPNTPLAMQ